VLDWRLTSALTGLLNADARPSHPNHFYQASHAGA
jgi:hypothetical protein